MLHVIEVYFARFVNEVDQISMIQSFPKRHGRQNAARQDAISMTINQVSFSSGLSVFCSLISWLFALFLSLFLSLFVCLFLFFSFFFSLSFFSFFLFLFLSFLSFFSFFLSFISSFLIFFIFFLYLPIVFFHWFYISIFVLKSFRLNFTIAVSYRGGRGGRWRVGGGCPLFLC